MPPLHSTLCVSPPFSCVWRLLPSSWFSSASSVLRSLTLYSTWVLFFFLVSFPWFWVSLSSFLLLSPLLEPSLLFFCVVCQVPAGGRSCKTTKKIDSALHIFSGCRHTQIRNMITERHNLACSMIFKAISKTGFLGSCFVCLDIGRSERLARPMQIFRTLIQLKPGLCQSGSFHPASQTKIGPDAV